VKERIGLLRRGMISGMFRSMRWAEELQPRLARWYLKASGMKGIDKVSTYTHPEELAALLRLVLSCPPGAQALEVGSYVGASACYLAGGLAKIGGRLYCLDTWQNETMPEGERDTYAEFMTNTRAVKDTIVPIRVRSGHAEGRLPAEVDLLFIDGDHSYEQVTRDIEVYGKLVKAWGLMVFHDGNTFEGVSRAIGDLAAGGGWTIQGQVRSLVWMRRAQWAAPSAGERSGSAPTQASQEERDVTAGHPG
jgi:cephalosporin hydroxylase